jgi:ribosome-associated translation inhibitor RaiA
VDINGPNKGGVDKECRVTVRMPGLPSVHVTETAETLFQAIDAARDRLERTVQRTVDKRRDVTTNGLPQDLAADVPTY